MKKLGKYHINIMYFRAFQICVLKYMNLNLLIFLLHLEKQPQKDQVKIRFFN